MKYLIKNGRIIKINILIFFKKKIYQNFKYNYMLINSANLKLYQFNIYKQK